MFIFILMFPVPTVYMLFPCLYG
uniref:Uncharacterized protein n=1 Tax=Anguilla anguilla TaxID=7936 RepID=A0A0E9PX81_ANGAN